MLMDAKEKMAVVDRILTRAAEEVGDLTPPAMAAYYRRQPQARELFAKHASGNMGNLYCLMYWYDSPGEVEILLTGSVPHHSDTLDVPPNLYLELLDATAGVIEETIPADNREERRVWTELCEDLRQVIRDSGRFALRP